MIVKNNGNGTYIVKKWLVIFTLISGMVSSVYSISMTFNILPLKKQIETVEINDKKQDSEIQALRIKEAENTITLNYIKDTLIEIKQILKENK